MENEYSFVKLLGSGTFGTCFLVKDVSSGKLCVLKALHDDDMSEELCQEVDILSAVSQVHENIVSYIDHFDIRALPADMAELCAKDCTHCIVTEFIEGETLLEFSKRVHSGKVELTPAFLSSLLRSGLDALRYLHEEAQIAHRDIKPANMLVTPDGRLVFIDFGLSVLLGRRTRAPQDDCGTPNYFSPSLVMLSRNEERATKQMWFASDVWAFGAAMYFLCTGSEVAGLYRNRERSFDEVLAFQCPAVLYDQNEELNAIVCSMLEPDQALRPSVNELLARIPVIRVLRKRERLTPPRELLAAPSPAAEAPLPKPRNIRAVLRPRNTGSATDLPIAKRTRQMAALAL